MFRDREDAAHQLADRLEGHPWHRPLVLAIPRGGVVVGAVLANRLGAELDVVLSRKLGAPRQPELALGAMAEDGQVYLNHYAQAYQEELKEYLAAEQRRQLAEIARRKTLVRAVRPPAECEDRSVIITDDGIATGSTMIAALQTIRARRPRQLVVAVPVAPPERLPEVRQWCDELYCLYAPPDFMAVGEFYQEFPQIDDEQFLSLLRMAYTPATP
ncbi:MAG: hypothetical protein K6T86_06870 [Pirellulales bacterium]|nr:hypothetical protein [Pirellulales bacterium]